MENLTLASIAPIIVVALLVIWVVLCAVPMPIAGGRLFKRVTGIFPTAILIFIAFNKFVAPYVTEIGPFLGGAIICAVLIVVMAFFGIKEYQERKSG